MMSSASLSISSPLSYLSANSADSIKSTVNLAFEVDPIATSPAINVPSVVPNFNILLALSHDLTLPFAPDILPVICSLNMLVPTPVITGGGETVAIPVPAS